MEIAAKVLEIAQKSVIKTTIMYGAFLSFTQLREYLDFLIENELLEHIPEKNLYRTTDKGKRFLNSYQELEHMMYPKKSKVLQKVEG